MLLLELRVTNFGLYQGEQVFALQPHRTPAVNGGRKPIILVGGNNGTGKTTLLSAVRLCLYGMQSLGPRMTRQTYHRYLRSCIHRPMHQVVTVHKDVPRTEVALIFQRVEEEQLHIYEVKRSWVATQDQIEEVLHVARDGEVVSDLGPAQWQDFLNELIPPGLAQFFFFDGEQIQVLAEDVNNEATAEAIRVLVGIDMVRRLQADLSTYRARRAKDARSTQLSADLDELEIQIQQLRSQLSDAQQNEAQVSSKRQRVKGLIEQQESKLTREGGGFARARGQLEAERGAIKAELEHLNHRLVDLAQGLLPFALAPELCRQLVQRLLSEQEVENKQGNLQALKGMGQEIEQELSTPSFWEAANVVLSANERQHLGQAISGLFQRFIENASPHRPPIHEISGRGRQQILAWLNEALNEVPAEVSRLCTRVEELTRQEQHIQIQLRQVPSDDILAPLMERLHALNDDAQKLAGEYRVAEERTHSVELRLAEIERKHAELKRKRAEANAVDERMRRAASVQKKLEQYERRLTDLKIRELEQAIKDLFNHLSRKKGTLQEVSIDPETFATTLYDRSGALLDKGKLSAGEKQIYAIAFLWALRRVSRRNLPVIIDTPLGRLDSEHRTNLIHQYFPYAADQVILLSTDTEIDQALFHDLAPAVSHAYQLQYNPEQGCTFVLPHYFWEPTKAIEDAVS